jgi:molecular chaperone Hsp33
MIEKAPSTDFVLPFAVEGRNARGRMARVDQALNDVLSAQAYPLPVASLLAEAVCLTALLGTMLKENGIMTFQINADGPVRLLFVDYTTAGHMRGYARFDEDVLEKMDEVELDRLVPQLLHSGTLSVTIDPEASKERYQGIVSLEGATLAQCLQAYFKQSEQLPTAIKVATEMHKDAEEGNGGKPRWTGGAIMLQPLPSVVGISEKEDSHFRSDEAEEDWRHSVVLLNSAGKDELLDSSLPAETLLFRLYHEDGVRVFDPHTLSFKCRCSAEKLGNVLRQFSREDIAEMTEEGQIQAQCDICGKLYRFVPDEFMN